jgi:hypothetical protein
MFILHTDDEEDTMNINGWLITGQKNDVHSNI